MRWIPVTERLPNESGSYLVTVPMDNGDSYVDALDYHKGKFYEYDSEWGDIEYDDVLAWMPLPEPYKADRKTEPNLILPERMERGERFEVGETIVVMNRDDYYDLLCKSWKDESHTDTHDEAIKAMATLIKARIEPQTDYGDFADSLAYERGVKHAWEVAQKVFDSTVTFYEAEDVAKRIDKDINVRSKDEPQTERSSDEY